MVVVVPAPLVATEATDMTLVEFLGARIAEDEALARRAWPERWEQDGDMNAVQTVETGLRGGWEGLHMGVAHLAMTVGNFQAEARNAAHIARYDPARVLAECEAKRRIVGMIVAWESQRPPELDDEFPVLTEVVHYPLRALAAVYTDHPDCRPEWKP